MPPRPRTPPRRFDPASLVALAAFAMAYAGVALMRGLPAWTHLLYAGASALCLVLYAVDKLAARAGRERIPESVLLSLGTVGGWPGAVVAQQVWRHKTVKPSFRVRFWLSVVVNVAVFAWATLA
jgi:uncharacterized membrane protein YsdA (DUF1294 family)